MTILFMIMTYHHISFCNKKYEEQSVKSEKLFQDKKISFQQKKEIFFFITNFVNVNKYLLSISNRTTAKLSVLLECNE